MGGAAREAAGEVAGAAARTAEEDCWSLSEGCLDAALEQEESSSFSFSEDGGGEEVEEEKENFLGKRKRRRGAAADEAPHAEKKRRTGTEAAAAAAAAAPAGARRKAGREERRGAAGAAAAGEEEEDAAAAGAAAATRGGTSSSSSSRKRSSSKILNPLLDTQTPWGNLGLSRPLLKAIEELRYEHPTRIQCACIRPALQGRDLLASAQTGSGKTAAFLLPTLERLLQSPGVRARVMSVDRRSFTGGLRGTKALLLLPTRELALQSFHVLQQLSKYTPVTHALACGGMTLKEQETALRQQPDIVVATPGRILDLLLNSPSVHLELLEIVILDEADRLLELGFREEILEILRHCHRAHQTLLFSATLTPSIAALAALALKAPLHVSAWGSTEPEEVVGALAGSASGRKRRAASAAAAAALKTVAPSLEQQFVALQHESHRLPALLHLCVSPFLKNTKVIIFFSTKHLAHETFLLFRVLGFKAAELHGNLTQQMRVDALHRFHSGEVNVLLASELASRGLDIAGVEAVINFHVPQDIDRYVHSAGRTARMGRSGVAVTLYDTSSSERLQVKQLLHALRGSDSSSSSQRSRNSTVRKEQSRGAAPAAKGGRAEEAGGGAGGEGRVLRRKIDGDKLRSWAKKISAAQKDVRDILKKERLEREMRLADLHLQKAENMQIHADEIYARPMRQWFMSSTEKQQVQKVSKAAATAAAAAASTKEMQKKKKKKKEDNDDEEEHGEASEKEEEEEEDEEEGGASSRGRAAKGGGGSDSETREEKLPSWVSACSDEEGEVSVEEDGEEDDEDEDGEEELEEELGGEDEEEGSGEEDDGEQGGQAAKRGGRKGERRGELSVVRCKGQSSRSTDEEAAAAARAEKSTHKKMATLSVKQRERVKELRLMKVAGRAVKKAQQQRRVRYDSTVEEPLLPRRAAGRQTGSKQRKNKRRRQGLAAAGAARGEEFAQGRGRDGGATAAPARRNSSKGKTGNEVALAPAAKKLTRGRAARARLNTAGATRRGTAADGQAERRGGKGRGTRRSSRVVTSKKGFKSKGRYKRRR